MRIVPLSNMPCFYLAVVVVVVVVVLVLVVVVAIVVVAVVVAIASINQYSAVRGRRTGSNTSGVKEIPRKQNVVSYYSILLYCCTCIPGIHVPGCTCIPGIHVSGCTCTPPAAAAAAAFLCVVVQVGPD